MAVGFDIGGGSLVITESEFRRLTYLGQLS
jgi:hypothetical protein